MADPIRPAAAKVYQRENWVYVPVIASSTLAPTVAEIAAASALDITNMVFADSSPDPQQTTQMVKQDKRLGDAVTYEFVGDTEITGGECIMSFNSQAAALADAVKAWEKFSAGGVTGFMVNRLNVPKATAFAAGQFVHVYPAEFGPFAPTKKGDGAAGQEAMKGSWAVTNPPAYKIAVLA